MKFMQYEVITGKGIHSQGRKAILHPGIIKFLEEEKYRFIPEDGKIFVLLNISNI